VSIHHDPLTTRFGRIAEGKGFGRCGVYKRRTARPATAMRAGAAVCIGTPPAALELDVGAPVALDTWLPMELVAPPAALVTEESLDAASDEMDEAAASADEETLEIALPPDDAALEAAPPAPPPKIVVDPMIVVKVEDASDTTD